MRALTIGNMYPPHSLGGYEQVWHGAVTHLRNRGHAVRVLTTDHREPGIGIGGDGDRDVHRSLRWYWKDHAFPALRPRERVALERHNLACLDAHIDAFRPQVVGWFAMGGMSLSLIERVRRRGLPAVGFVHDEWMLYGPQVDAWQRLSRRLGPFAGALGAVLRVPSRVSFERSARWVFVSEATRSLTLAEHRLADTAVAHSGIEIERFPRAAPRPWQGQLLYVGRLDERKGVAIALRALALLPEATLRIVGGGDERLKRSLEALGDELGVSERLRFARAAPQELGRIYAAADAVLFPVLWEEPWGLVPLESMAVGRPVIASGTGGSAEYLRDGENCLLYGPRDDPSALAAAVRRLAADSHLRARLREGGFETAPRFTAEAFNEAVEAELERAAAA